MTGKNKEGDHAPIRTSRPAPFDFSAKTHIHWHTQRSDEEVRVMHIEVSERAIFDALVATHKVCPGLASGGCACTGRCLGSKLANLRRITDHALSGSAQSPSWWSDQAHGWLAKRPHDSGQPGDTLDAENYYPPVKAGL